MVVLCSCRSCCFLFQFSPAISGFLFFSSVNETFVTFGFPLLLLLCLSLQSLFRWPASVFYAVAGWFACFHRHAFSSLFFVWCLLLLFGALCCCTCSLYWFKNLSVNITWTSWLMRIVQNLLLEKISVFCYCSLISFFMLQKFCSESSFERWN